MKSLPQPGTHSVVLSPPSCSGGGQERVSSKKRVSGKEAGEDVGKERGLEAAATGHSLSSAVRLFCDLPLPGVPGEGICRALALFLLQHKLCSGTKGETAEAWIL